MAKCNPCTATCAICQGCTGDCKGGCYIGCTATCLGTCTGGCGVYCEGGCSGGCRTGCSTTCTSFCVNDCEAECVDSCTNACVGMCQACAGGCGENCGTDCSIGCGYCTGCSGCGGCSNSCSGTCSDNCNDGCKDGNMTIVFNKIVLTTIIQASEISDLGNLIRNEVVRRNKTPLTTENVAVVDEYTLSKTINDFYTDIKSIDSNAEIVNEEKEDLIEKEILNQYIESVKKLFSAKVYK